MTKLKLKEAILSLGTLVVGCSPESAGKRTQVDQPAPVDYFNISKCWSSRPGENFKGAVAIFMLGHTQISVLYSGLCPVGDKLTDVERSSTVSVSCVQGIPGADNCTNKTHQVVQRVGPPLPSEFPKQLYAVEARLQLSSAQERGAPLLFNRIAVERYQKIPREMIGAFIYYPANRQALINEYLNGGPFTSDGYSIMK